MLLTYLATLYKFYYMGAWSHILCLHSWLKVDLARNDKTLILIIEYKNSGTVLMLL